MMSDLGFKTLPLRASLSAPKYSIRIYVASLKLGSLIGCFLLFSEIVCVQNIALSVPFNLMNRFCENFSIRKPPS